MFSSLNKTVPLDAFKFPAIKLNKVVFPEPFGPIMPVIDCFLIFKEQFDTAANPPKYFDKFSILRIEDSSFMLSTKKNPPKINSVGFNL